MAAEVGSIRRKSSADRVLFREVDAVRLALYEPDIAQNAGTMLRMAACLGIAVDFIEPAGFVLTDKGLRRAGMDYLPAALMTRHESFGAFDLWRRDAGHRLVLLTTKARLIHVNAAYHANDILMVGRESAGVPDRVHAVVDAEVRIPMLAGMRSLNVAISAAMVVSEALRQTGGFPPETIPQMHLGLDGHD